MSKYPYQRLRQSRKDAKYPSAAAFWRVVGGITEGGYRHHENGKRGFNEETAKRYAAPLGKTAYWLLTGEEVEPEPALALEWGSVGAGEQIELFPDDGRREWVDAPPGLVDGVAVRVRGDSMEPAYRHRDLLFFSQTKERPKSTSQLRDYIVQVRDGPIYCKRIKKGNRGRYTLLSYAVDQPPIKNVQIAWCAPVEWVKRNPGRSL